MNLFLSLKTYIQFYTVIILLVGFSLKTDAQCNCDRRRDSLALISLYNATNGTNWKNKWILTQPINQWWGVGLTHEGCVEWLDLDGEPDGLWSEEAQGNNLSGSLPTAIGDLCKIRILSLNDNPLLKGNLPNTISSLKSLAFLYLDNCAITSPIPNSFWALTQLEDLSLKNNPLNMPFPSQLENFQKLFGFNFQNCQLYGTIPSELGNMSSLKRIFIGQNKLTGAIPASFRNLNLSQFVWDKNLLDSMPDLSSFPFVNVPFHGAPYGVVCTNKFTFDDILPIIHFKNRGLFCYEPQDSIFKDTTINVISGNDISINLKIDGAITTNSYRWFKDGKAFQTTAQNTLILRGVTTCDNGIYTVTVTNPNAPDLTLYSRKIKVVVTGATPTKTQNISITVGDNYTLPSGKIVATTGIYKDTLKAKNGCDSLIFTTNLTIKTEENITIEAKPLGITPNGDGLNDVLIFDNITNFPDRELSILNRWGQVVFQQKNYDNTWQGTNQKGEPLPEGTYYFVLKLDITHKKTRMGDVAIVR